MPSYVLKCSGQAIKALHKLEAEGQERVEDVLEEVAETEQPSNHPKVEFMSNSHDKKCYKIRVGDYRAVAHLEKPVLKILRFGPRDSVYQDINEVYESL